MFPRQPLRSFPIFSNKIAGPLRAVRIEFYRRSGRLVVYACLIIAAAGIAKGEERYFSLRGVAGLPAEAAVNLARASEPLWYTVLSERGESLTSIVHQVCGDQSTVVSKFLLSEASRLNSVKDLSIPIGKDVAVALPFCLKVERNVRVIVKEGDTLEKVLKENYGVFGSKTISRTFQLNVDGSSNIDLKTYSTNLKPGDQVILPYAAPERTFVSLPTPPSTLPEILRPLNIERSPNLIRNSIKERHSDPDRQPYQLSYIRAVNFESAKAASECVAQADGVAAAGALRPFDTAILKQHVELELKKKQGDSPPQPVTVGIIDTGISDFDTGVFHEKYFSANIQELRGKSEEDDDVPANNFIDDVYGINFNTMNGRIAFYPTDQDRSHGTKMATLILGGVDAESLWSQATTPMVRLKVVNFSSSLPGRGTVEANHLSEALFYLSGQGASIINMSLKSTKNLLPISNAIVSANRVLFVVAAGNAERGEGNFLGSEAIFPARYGGRVGDHKRQVLTVGAHDLRGKRANFSNFSNEFVDILAPGCSVMTRDVDGTIGGENGTSPATAIVSFAAAVISVLGETSPNNIKNRILSSSDFDMNLAGDAWSSGRVNIIKAISLYHDLIDLGAGVTSYASGRLENKEDLPRFCSSDALKPLLHRIRKIIPNIQSATGNQIEYWVEQDGLLSKVRCAQDAGRDPVIAISAEDNSVKYLKIGDIVDIVLSSKN